MADLNLVYDRDETINKAVEVLGSLYTPGEMNRITETLQAITRDRRADAGMA